MPAHPSANFDLESSLVPAALELPSNVAYLSHLEILAQNPTLIRLQSNENTMPPSYETANLYASPLHPLRGKLAEQHNVETGSILMGAGATEGIEATLRTFVRAGDHVVIPTPTWPVYRRRFTALEANFQEVPMFIGETSYQYDIDAMLAAIKPETKLVVLVTPNNPTGNILSEHDVRLFLESGCMILLDHAYRDFIPENDLCHLVHEYQNLLVAVTFSKSYSLAGLRLGYILGDPEALDYIDRFLVPGSGVSTTALNAGFAALQDTSYHHEQVERIISERDRMIERARGLGLRAFDSGGNFFAIDVSGFEGGVRRFTRAVMEHGVLIRVQTDTLVRVTTGTAEENELAYQALQNVVKEYM